MAVMMKTVQMKTSRLVFDVLERLIILRLQGSKIALNLRVSSVMVHLIEFGLKDCCPNSFVGIFIFDHWLNPI